MGGRVEKRGWMRVRDVVEADVSDGHSHSHESAVVEPTSRARPISTSQLTGLVPLQTKRGEENLMCW